MNKEIQEQKINTMLKHIQNLVVELKGYSLPSRAAEAALRGLEVELYREGNQLASLEQLQGNKRQQQDKSL